METANKTSITVTATVNKPVAKVWATWNSSEHIMQWASASDDWHAPYADNDLREGGQFKTTMAAKDGSFSFDFGGVYTTVREHSLIEYTLSDSRKVSVRFVSEDGVTTVTETFEAENEHPVEMQQAGWQAILDRFKVYTEALV